MLMLTSSNMRHLPTGGGRIMYANSERMDSSPFNNPSFANQRFLCGNAEETILRVGKAIL